VHLIAEEAKKAKTLSDAVLASLKKIKGAYALAIMSTDEPDTMLQQEKMLPSFIGLGENEHYIAMMSLQL
jgi:glucosamine--fructose-6-phosphate aminotransferase (isomerizing)